MIHLNMGRVTEALQQSERYWQEQHQAEAEAGRKHPLPLNVALTRQAGVPGSIIARAVGERLGWSVYDQELVEHIAREMRQRPEVVQRVDERHVPWLLETLEALSSEPRVSESGYVRQLVQVLASLATRGECVLLGRGAAQILPAATTLRVRLIGDWEDRIETTVRRRGISRAEAIRWVEETDNERQRFVQDHFHKDPTDPSQYDLIVNATRFTIDQTAEIIATAVRCRRERGATK
jgi:hypothetical protein